MGKIAIDVALLPEEAMAERVIAANAELVEQFGGEIVLDRETCLPHISLAMGSIDEQDIASIQSVLEIIGEKYPVGELTVPGVYVHTNTMGETVSLLGVEKTRDLQTLHEKVMEKLKPYCKHDVTEGMIYGDEEVAATTLQWIKDYAAKASFGNFLPHMTVGYGELEQSGSFPIAFAAAKLALCHLGNHCTCRKILASVDL
ncbi:MAG: 2'-5' RNA ligase family protein [Phycisphaerales bacterium]|nr:MAG: 2'-5' RNA ligase family protein [Phycisphaerales bacterium]